MQLRLEKYSFQFAEQVLNSKLALKQEVESILQDRNINISNLSRPKFNEILKELFIAKNWSNQPHVFDDEYDPIILLR